MEKIGGKHRVFGQVLHQGHLTPELCYRNYHQASILWLQLKLLGFNCPPPTPLPPQSSLGWGAEDAALPQRLLPQLFLLPAPCFPRLLQPGAQLEGNLFDK